MDCNGKRIKVSVIIPAYNSEQFIKECIESVLASTLEDMEIILVDDGSTDGTGSICDEFAVKYGNISVIHQKNMGQNTARLNGVLAAQGEFIGFVDSDDWIDREMFCTLWKKAIEYNADMVCCGCIYEKAGSREIRYNRLAEGLYDSEMIWQEVLPYVLAFGSNYDQERLIEPHLCDKLFKRELVRRELLDVDKRITWGEDALVTLMCIAESEKMSVLRYAPYHYRVHKDSVSRKNDERALVSYAVLLTELLEHCKKYQICARQVRWYGITAARDMLKIGLGVQNSKFWQFPYHDFAGKTQIILYGAGEVGYCYYVQLAKNSYFSKVIWTDSSYEKQKNDRRICTINEALTTEYDFVIIAVESEKTAMEIKKGLLEKKVLQDKIYWKKPEWIEGTFVFKLD